MTTPELFSAAAAEAEANARLRNHIARSAGQHRRAVARSFAEARDALESRARHQIALAQSNRHHINAQSHA